MEERQNEVRCRERKPLSESLMTLKSLIPKKKRVAFSRYNPLHVKQDDEIVRLNAYGYRAPGEKKYAYDYARNSPGQQ
ncbi:hypothetical protein OK016_24290 [Vibrio chagasii]|nr:hypothetical protein [Vibrio chagasii]